MPQTLLEELCVYWDFPGGPVVRTQPLHYQGLWFSPWWGNSDPASQVVPLGKTKHFVYIKFMVLSLHFADEDAEAQKAQVSCSVLRS